VTLPKALQQWLVKKGDKLQFILENRMISLDTNILL